MADRKFSGIILIVAVLILRNSHLLCDCIFLSETHGKSQGTGHDAADGIEDPGNCL